MKFNNIHKASLGGLWIVLATLSGCWSSATVCQSDTDCFLGEVCGTDNQCVTDPNFTMKPTDATPDLKDPCPTGQVKNAAGMCVPSPNKNNAQNNTPIQCTGDQQSLCSGECVNTSTNPLYCGDCNTRCDQGQVCDNGTCRTVADCATEGCVGDAYCDTDTNTCIPGCIEDSQCAPGLKCTDNTCACPRGTHLCGDRCADSSSIRSCGNRCEPCPGGDQAICAQSQCMLACPDGERMCNGSCVPCPGGAGLDETTCQNNRCVAKECTPGQLQCGGRCLDCPDDPNGEALCGTNNQCALLCDEGFKKCGGSCAPCPGGPNVLATACTNDGQCVATSCAGGALPCDTGCCGFSDPPNGPVDTQDPGYKSSIAITPTGEVHIVYSTGTDRNAQVKHATWDGISQWVIKRIARGVAGGPKSLTVDAQGTLHAAFWDPSANTVYHASNTGNGWNISTVASHQWRAQYQDIAIQTDAANTPHIAYTYDQFVVYATRTQGSWGIQNVDASAEKKHGADIKLIPPNDVVRISYATDRKIMYAREVGGVFSTHTLGGMFIDPIRASHTSLIYTNNGYPVVIFDSSSDRSIDAFLFQGAGWSRINIQSNLASSFTYDGLGDVAYDDFHDLTHIAYVNLTTKQTRYAKVSTNTSSHNSIAAWPNEDETRPDVALDDTSRAHYSYSAKTSNVVRVHYHRP